ncbi:MAG: hypothetical protein ACKO7P_15365 [Bacteroidota bacterium]
MKANTIRFLTAICACLLIISALFFWLQISLEYKYGQGFIRLYMFNDFSAISTLFLSVAIIILQFLKPKKDDVESEILD